LGVTLGRELAEYVGMPGVSPVGAEGAEAVMLGAALAVVEGWTAVAVTAGGGAGAGRAA
jgi:hypothetical protein